MINLYTRKENGAKTRKAGFIPAEIYGYKTENKSVYLSIKDTEMLSKLINRTKINEVSLEENSLNILVKAVQRHPVTDKIIHIDLYEAEKGHLTNAKIPIILKGTPQGVKIGGTLNHARTSINVTAPATEIPNSIELDVSDMKIGSVLRATDIELPKNIRIKGRSFFTIASVVGRAKEEVKSEEEEEEAAS